MKLRKIWVWTLKTTDGTTWYGTCPKWAAEPVPEGAVLTKARQLYAGKMISCHLCGGTHADLAKPHVEDK